MTVVVDLGCANHNNIDSIRLLAKRFKPDVIYGFDPLLPLNTTRWHGRTKVVRQQKAAWTHDGVVDFRDDGVASCVIGPDGPTLREEMRLQDSVAPRWVECFDLAAWLYEMGDQHRLLPGDHVVVKMDVEGAEYTLLHHLMKTGAIGVIDLLLIEWHWQPVENLPCPIEDWAY